MKVTVLGCGGSGGVPLADGTPGGYWGDCDPSNPKNRRRRVSILVETRDATILVDASPDLRAQLLDAAVARIDAVLMTHAHADHCHGLDELRSMIRRGRTPIPTYMSPQTRAILTQRFDYVFTSSCDPENIYPPMLEDRSLDGAFTLSSTKVVPFVQGHGKETSTGFRIGDVAYSTDVVSLDEAAFAALEGLELWIVDCLRERPHPTHAHLELTLEWIARAKPKRAVLTHMNQEADYEALKAMCPPGVEPGYDGMVIEVGG